METRSVFLKGSSRAPVIIVLALAVLLSLVAAPFQTSPAQALGVGCMTGSPASGAYTVTLCFTSPADSAVLSGTQTVSISTSTSGANPGIARIIFYLGGQYLLMDFQAPYSFNLPTDKWVDGTRTLEVEAFMKDGYTSPRASINVTFQNNVTTPPVNTNTFTIRKGTTPPAGQPFTMVASGDGADGMLSYSNVTDLITSWNPNLFLYLGDVYQKGSTAEFLNWYGTPGTYLGRLKGITNPVIGNHEYENGVAPGYFDYWDNIPNYYSYDVNGWHFIAINSNCGLIHDCAVGQAQYNWLQNDLNTHNNACTIAYYHHPLFNVGPEGSTTTMADMWALMASKGVDIVLNGHDHNYQRYLPLDGNGVPAANGITEFVTGAGGHGTQGFITTDSRLAAGFDASPYAFGALRFQLNSQGASFQYINYQGIVLDSGAIPCSGTPADVTPPTTPGSVTASVYSSTAADLSWSSSADNVGVAGYNVYRDGVQIASLGYANSYRDSGLAMGASYNYQVKARDAAGNLSLASSSVPLTMPNVLFSDGFESGSLAAWLSNTNMVVQTAEHYSGAYSVRGTSSSAAPHASNLIKDLSAGQIDLYYSLSFKIHSLGSTSAYLQRFRTSTNTSLAGIFVNGSNGKLGFRNDFTPGSITNGPVVSLNAWHKLQTHILINGASSTVEVWLDDILQPGLGSTTQSLGTTPVGRIQLGDSSTTDVYDISFDDVAASNSYINTIDSQAPTTPSGLAAIATAPNSVSLSWNPATDNISVSGYDIFRDNTLLAAVGIVTSYVDTTTSPVFTYNYQVRARDAAGNTSNLSSPVTLTTPADTTPPAIALTSPASGLTVSGNLQLAADATDDVAIEHVDLLVNNNVVATQQEGPYAFTLDTTTLPDGTQAVITARAVDTSGNATTSLSSTVTVNNAGGDLQPPTNPGNFNAAAAGASRVDMSWTASADNFGVTGYDIYRGGSLLTSLGAVTNYSDTSVSAGGTYQYAIQARDAAGNMSALVSAPALTVPLVLFADGFESGDLSNWTNNGLVVAQQSVLEGAYAAHASSSGAAASYAYKALSTARPDLYFSTWFKINSQGATSAYLQRFRTSANGAILGVFVSNTGKLGYRNDLTATSTSSAVSVSQGVWHLLQSHVKINDTNSQVEVWLDGAPVSALSKTDALGTTSIGRVQLGDSQSTDVYDVLFDESAIDTSFLNGSALPYTMIDSGPLGLTASNIANFSFSSTAAGAGFECSLDSMPFAACSSPQSITGLGDGAHSFAVRATDSQGRLDATPASHAWTVDTTAPAVQTKSPADAAIDIGVGTSLSAFFSEALDPASLTSTNFSLTLQGSLTPLAAAISYDPATNSASLAPATALDYLNTYTATLKGGPGGVTDLAGNPLPADVAWSFTTVAPDTTPPAVSLTAPLDGAVVSGVVTLNADATDNVGVTRVDFLVNGVVVGSDLSAPYSFDWNAASTPNGTVSLTAQAQDARGNMALSTPVNVAIANDVTPPSVPANLAANAVSGAQVDLTWTASTDNLGVTGYDIFRNGLLLASTAATTNYSDMTVSPANTYQYQLRARDAAGNLSALSAAVSASTPAALFIDRFESGDLSKWVSVSGLVVQQQEVFAGAYAARATSTGAVADAFYQFPTAQYDLYYALRFKYLSQDPASSIYLLRFRKADTFSTLGVFVSPTGKLGYRNDIAGTTFTTLTNVSLNTWHLLQAHISIDPAGGPGKVELWYDGASTALVSQAEGLSNAPIARIQLGDAATGRSYDIAFDNVSVASFFVNPEDFTPPVAPANLAAIASTTTSISMAWDPASDNVGVTGYKLYRNGALVATLGSLTSYTDTGLTPGTNYQYQVSASDAAENNSPLSASVMAATMADITPPAVVLTAPAAGSYQRATVSLAATATDDVAIARVEFQVNGALVASVTTAPYTFAWNSSTFPDGAASITARAVDSSNNATLSSPVSVTVDNTPPNTIISTGPAAYTNTTTASFALTANEASSIFVCSLDGAVFGACSSPATFSGLLNGAHTFQVAATDRAGNTDASPASWNWTVDTIQPTVTSSNPANSARNVNPLVKPAVTFSEAMDPASLTSATYTIKVKQNGSTPLAATASYDPLTHIATLTPSAVLLNQTTYQVTVKSGAAGVKDLAGNAMAVDYTWQFTTGVLDTTPPTVSVSSPAAGAYIKGSTSLAASASDNVAVASVDFLVNGVVVGTDTTSPYSFTWNSTSLADGAATITARATDTSLNSTTSAGVTINVDNTPPDTTITSAPTGTVFVTTASFSFSSTETGSTFGCSLDGAAFSACTSPLSYSGLASATHTFQVRATDLAGNLDPTPASQSWTVNATAPDTSITAGSSGSVKSTSASFSFTSTKAGSTFSCSLDGPVFSACVSPVTYNNLANGSHTFQVRATDTYGNTDPTPAVRTWSVDNTAPTGVAITSPQNGASVSGQITISATASDNIAIVSVGFYVDGQLLSTSTTSPYSAAWNTKKYAKGTHNLYVLASDAAGNTTQSATISVTVQ